MAFAIWWGFFKNSGPNLTHKVVLVDITTGDLFEFATDKKSVLIPERNPINGKISLFPTEKAPDGKWLIQSRFLDSLGQIDGTPDALLNKKTGEVRVKSESPRSVSLAERAASKSK